MTPKLVLPLENPVKNYAWGSRSALSSLRGASTPSAEPEAELWMGAHPAASSRALLADGARSLAELIAENPGELLGGAVERSFGGLPFLLKLLAAAEPLSLQAHPNREQARAGFERENDAGIALDARERSYKDQNHKPELIAALTPFSALCGFREPAATRRLFQSLAVPELEPHILALAESPEKAALRAFFELVTRARGESARTLAAAVLSGCRRANTTHEFAAECAWGVRIGELYPGDAGVVLALALNLVVLAPGQAIYLPAGNLHAYLEGTGVEIMASSDNVLRGGLTPKHVDVPELLAVLDFRSEPVSLAPAQSSGVETRYVAPAREFALSRLDLAGERAEVAPVTGPEIVVVTAGVVRVERGPEALTLAAGASAFLPPGVPYVLSGAGQAFRARVNG